MASRWRAISVDVMEDGSGVYVARIHAQEPDANQVARSESPHEAVTLDFDAGGNLVGVEVVAVPANLGRARDSLVSQAIRDGDGQ